MEHHKGKTKECGESHHDTRLDALLQDFSHYVEKRIHDKEFVDNIQCSEELLLQTTFPKQSVEPLERYLCIDQENRLKVFFESLRPYDVVLGKVASAFGSHISVTLLEIIDGQNRYISDLNVVSQVESSKAQNASCSSADDDDLKIGDKVKGVVTHVEKGDGKIIISFNEKLLGKDQVRHFPLGKVSAEEESYDSYCGVFSHDGNRFMDATCYIQDLENSSEFIDPHSIKRILNKLKLPEQCVSFLRDSFPVILTASIEQMREKQSAKWSMDMVGVGVKHFREQRLKEAMKCFDQSISFYPKNVEAYVARGALKANKIELKEAVEDFREALKLNPKHRNARKYIIETLSSMGKRYEKEMKWKEASHCYKDILDLDADNKDALKQYNQIKQILAPKRDEPPTPKPTSPEKPKTLSVKSKERINKLKKLLEAETNRSEDSSSSSSSSSSDSDTSSDEAWVEKTDEVWVERTNDNARSNSKGKKRRRESSSLDT